jgi:pSer/pThr/pTyr-binding forkhead associated (FHA) protein
MRVLVKRGLSLIHDLRFSQGPIYIGRKSKSQIFLPDRAVSRQHAVFFTNPDGTWMLQDLDSANRTLLNGRPVSKMPLHEGDLIHVADFTIEVHFGVESPVQTTEEHLDLGDTIIHAKSAVASVYGKQTQRRPEHVLHLVPARVKDIYQITVTLTRLNDQETLLTELNRIVMEQFDAYHVWTGLRETTSGPLTCHGGLSRGGNPVSLDRLLGKGLVKQAMQSESYVLLPNIVDAAAAADSSIASLEHLRSALAAPIMAPTGAYGVIYIDNGCDQPAYSNLDLDYLTIVSTYVAALIEHIG